jgi:protein-tyrosine phosphatase
MPAGNRPFKVFFVCMGNRCRSPFAEGTFRRLTRGLPVEVGSAGTLNAEGLESPREIHQLAAAAGMDLRTHRSQWLRSVALPDADLVVGFELGHVAGAVIEGGAPKEKVFRLPELVRLLEQVPPPRISDPAERARAMVSSANALRATGGRKFSPDDDVADPFRGPMKGYERMADRITQLTEKLVAELFGSATPG